MMDIVNEDDGEMRTEVVHIRHDYVPKYYYDCKMQGHTWKNECKTFSKQKEVSKEVHV